MAIKKFSIQKRFTIGLVSVISLTLLLTSTAFIAQKKQSIENELKSQLIEATKLATKSLSSALWQYNETYVDDFVESLFLYKDIVFVQVLAGGKSIRSKSTPAYEFMQFEQFSASDNFITTSAVIQYEGMRIGAVRLALSTARVQEMIVADSMATFSILFLIIVATLVTVFFLSKLYIFRPLAKLEKSAKTIAQGDLDAPIDTRSHDEIGQLAGTFKQMIGSLKSMTASRDELNHEIQERRKAELQIRNSLEEKEILLREIHHRVKNNLQIVQSMLSLQSTKMQNPEFKLSLGEANSRIKAMALIHETLYRSEDVTLLDLNSYFRQLVTYLYKVYLKEDRQVETIFKIEPLYLDLDTTIACGLIVNELVTNAFKYAFPDDQEGQLCIELHRNGDHQVELIVADNGIGLPDHFDVDASESLGLKIVTMLVEDQLQGNLMISRQHGTAFSCTFLLEDNQEEH